MFRLYEITREGASVETPVLRLSEYRPGVTPIPSALSPLNDSFPIIRVEHGYYFRPIGLSYGAFFNRRSIK